jgi:hypothetical protein
MWLCTLFLTSNRHVIGLLAWFYRHVYVFLLLHYPSDTHPVTLDCFLVFPAPTVIPSSSPSRPCPKALTCDCCHGLCGPMGDTTLWLPVVSSTYFWFAATLLLFFSISQPMTKRRGGLHFRLFLLPWTVSDIFIQYLHRFSYRKLLIPFMFPSDCLLTTRR